jgi:hypothetical protein
MFQSYLDDAV